jgi:hypothetical protein
MLASPSMDDNMILIVKLYNKTCEKLEYNNSIRIHVFQAVSQYSSPITLLYHWVEVTVFTNRLY